MYVRDTAFLLKSDIFRRAPYCRTTVFREFGKTLYMPELGQAKKGPGAFFITYLFEPYKASTKESYPM